MTKFKICGLRDPDHALVAAKAGADFIGMVFVPGVRREITQEIAQSIIQTLRSGLGSLCPRLVGLFADQPIDEVNRIVRQCGLDMVQLCGDESVEYWAYIDIPIIKQIKIRDEDSQPDSIKSASQEIEEVRSAGHMVILDKYEQGAMGGTGKTFDWIIAKNLADMYDVILAGGLTPDNVGRAIQEVHPLGVDVSSGVETAGVKDASKILDFANEVHRIG